MVEKLRQFIEIDLNQFKLRIHLKQKIELTLHFDSPSRRFYLSVIALIVNEMKKMGRIKSIPLEQHVNWLVLLNETVGGSAGSSDKENLLPRIYRKWKDALPNLEEAPLFKVIGRRKEYDETGVGKTYQFSEAEKDSWANLFEYKGSHENVRLRFSIDKLGMSLDGIVIIYEDSLNGDAWERFIMDLKGRGEERPILEDTRLQETEALKPQVEKWKIALFGRYRWAALVAISLMVLGAVILAVRKTYFKPLPFKVASMERMAFPLPDKPSIAVLPFVNMSEDPNREYFADGLTEEIITALSKAPQMLVIAHNSTFTYKGKPTKVQQVAEELGVRYVLEGSVRWAGNRIRITTQLTDALTGYHLWSERYDRDLKDILVIQEEITKKIIAALEVKLTEGEQALLTESGTDNFEAYMKFLQARESGWHMDLEGLLRARRICEEVIVMDSNYAMAYSFLAGNYVIGSWVDTTKSPQESLKKADELAKKALSLNKSLANAHGILCQIYIHRREYEKGIEEGRRAVELAPNGADAHALLGSGLQWGDRPEEAIQVLNKAIRLNPIAPAWYLHNLALAYKDLGKYEEALECAEKAVQRSPKNLLSRITLCEIYSLLDRMEEARNEVEEILKIDQKFSLAQIEKVNPKKDSATKRQAMEALRKAGLK
jgi:TolB-like protein